MSKFDVVVSHGASIPSICLGTCTLKGGAGSVAVAHAIASGYRHIDTATMYDNEEAGGAGWLGRSLFAGVIRGGLWLALSSRRSGRR